MDEFSFPYPPYEIQTRLMNEIIQCIENKQIGIFESPTGTGKSLSVLCATLTWLKSEEKRQSSELERMKAQIKEIEEKDDDDWIEAHRRKLAVEREMSVLQEEMDKKGKIREGIEEAERRDKEVGERTAKVGKRKHNADEGFSSDRVDDDVAPPEDYNSDNEQGGREKGGMEEGQKHRGEEEEQVAALKIIYASRTHSQLQQLIEEVMKTSFTPRIVTIASRSALCANEDVKRLKHNHLINEKCMELRKSKEGGGEKRLKNDENTSTRTCSSKSCSSSSCPFYKQQGIEKITDAILARRLKNIEEIANEGSLVIGCPYFATRKALPICDLVLTPYQVLLHEQTRAAWGLDLKDNVVVLDEAHNVLQTIGSLYSAEITANTVLMGLNLVKQYIDTYKSRLKAKNLEYMEQLRDVLIALEKGLKETTQGSQVYTLQSFVIKMNLISFNLHKLVAYMDKTDLCRKFHGFFIRLKKRTEKEKEQANQGGNEKKSGVAKLLAAKNSKKEDKKAAGKQEETKPPEIPKKLMNFDNLPSPLFSIKSFFTALNNPCDDGRIIAEGDAKNPKFRFILLNPALRLQEVVSKARAVLLVGGTMEPAQLLIDCLKESGLPDSSLRRFSCSHVIDDTQLLALSLDKGIDGKPLTFTYANRSPQLWQSLGRTLICLISSIPKGCVAFFPSYQVLSDFVAALNSSGIAKQLQEKKQLFVESRDGNEVWQKYVNAVNRHEKGALLCAVAGGKLSEGINFSDDLGRAVFMIGLPYPNKESIELKEKMKYLSSRVPNGGGLLYNSLCLHTVNQAIGRAIRHRNDFASVILIDSRFRDPSVCSQLSAWISSRIRPLSCETFVKESPVFYANNYAKQQRK